MDKKFISMIIIAFFVLFIGGIYEETQREDIVNGNFEVAEITYNIKGTISIEYYEKPATAFFPDKTTTTIGTYKSLTVVEITNNSTYRQLYYAIDVGSTYYFSTVPISYTISKSIIEVKILSITTRVPITCYKEYCTYSKKTLYVVLTKKSQKSKNQK